MFALCFRCCQASLKLLTSTVRSSTYLTSLRKTGAAITFEAVFDVLRLGLLGNVRAEIRERDFSNFDRLTITMNFAQFERNARF